MISGIDAPRLRQDTQRDLVILNPLPIRLPFPQALLHFFIRDDTFLIQVDDQHLTRLQTALERHILRLHGQHTRLRSDYQQPVLSY